MPAVLAMLVNMLRTMLMIKGGVIIAKILLFFGLEFATYNLAVEPIMNQLYSLINDGPGGDLGGTLMQWGGVLKFDRALTMVLSAYTTAAAIRSTKAVLGMAGSE